MKRRKNCMKLNVLAMIVLPVVLGSCGEAGPADADAGRIESSEDGDQEAGSLGTEGAVDDESPEPEGAPIEEASESRTERVDNPDGWTILEYGETGEEARQSVYDADGNQIQANLRKLASISERMQRKSTMYGGAVLVDREAGGVGKGDFLQEIVEG